MGSNLAASVGENQLPFFEKRFFYSVYLCVGGHRNDRHSIHQTDDKKYVKTQTSIIIENKNKKSGYGFGILVALGMTFGVALGAVYGAYSGNISLGVGMGLIIGVFGGVLFGVVKNRK